MSAVASVADSDGTAPPSSASDAAGTPGTTIAGAPSTAITIMGGPASPTPRDLGVPTALPDKRLHPVTASLTQQIKQQEQERELAHHPGRYHRLRGVCPAW